MVRLDDAFRYAAAGNTGPGADVSGGGGGEGEVLCGDSQGGGGSCEIFLWGVYGRAVGIGGCGRW